MKNSNEVTPLLLSYKTVDAGPASSSDSIEVAREEEGASRQRKQLYLFLEARTASGLLYEKFMLVLIFLSVSSFVLGTLFDPDYSMNDYAGIDGGVCGSLCDGLFFGNYSNNFLQFLGIGPTSILEIGTVLIFTMDYMLRIYTADLENSQYSGLLGRIRYLPTFYSLIDLISIVPFYVDSFILVNTSLAASQFMRMFRIFRMMKGEGRAYSSALTLFDDVFYQQRGILATALFVGMTTWVAISSLYYLAERRNNDMIYCGSAVECSDVDTSQCTFDTWGFVDCPACPSTPEVPYPCYNMYRSILSASYYSLLNLFGEFPLISQHSPWGKLVGTFVAVIAVAVFALPAGIIANGFEELLEERQNNDNSSDDNTALEEEFRQDPQLFISSDTTLKGRLYNFFHVSNNFYGHLLNCLVLGTTLTFICSSSSTIAGTSITSKVFDTFEFLSVLIFTLDYIFKVYCITEHPYYLEPLRGRLLYIGRFLPIVDLLSFAPFWIALAFFSAQMASNLVVKCMRLFRLFRFERYTKAFTTFDDVIRQNYDMFVVTGIAALILWVFFSAVMYLAERSNPDEETAVYYSTVPQAMWVTLLNLSGESPLCNYSVLGKIVTGLVGIFASGLFGIPIGIVGSGFEKIVADETSDTPDEIEEQPQHPLISTATNSQIAVFQFVNGEGSSLAAYFETLIYSLIILTVCIGVLQTVQGFENTLHVFEWVAVITFTIEYILRFYAAPADPDFSPGLLDRPWKARLTFLFSFYSIIDLLAILPMYLAYFMPGSWVDKHDEYLRMLRLIRLLKLEKYFPSITLIDDVLRLKKRSLIITGYAAGTLWVIFAGMLYLAEYNDTENGIDNVPLYGCDNDCTMSDRFKSFMDSMVYTCIHLTGDYPIITYKLAARFACFFMVIAAVGVVSVFSALIAEGFTQIARSKSKENWEGDGFLSQIDTDVGGDWYEYQLNMLKVHKTCPPASRFGPVVDRLQIQVNNFLNGHEDADLGTTVWTPSSLTFRAFMMIIIIANVAAVVLESVPEIDKKVGNQPGNFFDVFEAFSVFIFAIEYSLRLFSAQKNRNALFSPLVYATTFFGIVDFLSTAPWFIEQMLLKARLMSNDSEMATVFRILRIFRILQLEDFIVAFSKLDNVFRASKGVLKATGLMAILIWVGCGALFFIFEQNNPNWRECDASVPLRGNVSNAELGCYDFDSITDCNKYYGEGMCHQTAFTNMPDSLYYTAVFLGGEWGVVDFTAFGRLVCVFLCATGITLYAIPVGAFIDSFGAVIGLSTTS